MACMNARPPYPTDVKDDECEFGIPRSASLPLDAAQRTHDSRGVFNVLRYLMKGDLPWRSLPHDFQPWYMVYLQTQRWFGAGCFEAIAHDLRVLLPFSTGRDAP